MSEHLEPVRAWSDLRTLLRVVIRGCQICGGEHAGTLVKLAERTVPIFEATHLAIDWAAAWIVSPSPPCVPAGAAAIGRTVKKAPEYAITPLAVDQGRVFRIVDGEEQAVTRSRKLERIE